MSLEIINVSTPNDGLGDTLRTSQIKANENFADLEVRKVDKITGKSLSKNDFTDSLQSKLNGIQPGAEVNVQSDWNQDDDQADDFIKNKPVGQFLQAFGTLHYSNTLATQNAVANVELKLLNNAVGAYTNVTNAPFGTGTIWNSTTNRFDFTSLEVGDYVEFRPDLDIDLVGSNTSFSVYMKMAIGGVNPWRLNIHNAERKSTDSFNEAPYIGFDISNEETKTLPAEIFIKTDANATVKVNGWLVAITRKSVNIIDIEAGDEYVVNKQNNLAPDGTGVKYPTVDAINNAVIKKSGTPPSDPITGDLHSQKGFISTWDEGFMQLGIDIGDYRDLRFDSKGKVGTDFGNVRAIVYANPEECIGLEVRGLDGSFESYQYNLGTQQRSYISVGSVVNETLKNPENTTFTKPLIIPNGTASNQAVNLGQLNLQTVLDGGNFSDKGIVIEETDEIGFYSKSLNNRAAVFEIGEGNESNISEFRKDGNIQASITHDGKFQGTDATEPNQAVMLGQLSDVSIPLSGTEIGKPITGVLKMQGNELGIDCLFPDVETNGRVFFYENKSFIGVNGTFGTVGVEASAEGVKIIDIAGAIGLTSDVEFTNDGTNRNIYPQTGWVQDFVSLSLTGYEVQSNKDQNNGYCGLDSGGKVPIANLPTTLLKYQGVWNATTNTPTLTNPDTTKIGNVYNVSVAGTRFGITWGLGDWLIYNASGVPEKSDNSDDVVSVNGQTGVVTLTTANVADSTNKRYVTDANLTVIGNQSGTNTGDQDLSGKLDVTGYLTIASSSTAVTLTASSPRFIIVTGSAAQTINLPVTSTLSLGYEFNIINASTNTTTVNSSGGNAMPTTVANGISCSFYCILTSGTTAASWLQNFSGSPTRTGNGGLVYNNFPFLNIPSYAITPTFTAGTNAQGQGTITTDVTVITTTPNSPSGVTLVGASPSSRHITIINKGTNPINVYPASGSAIDALGLNNPYQIPVNGVMVFRSVSSTQWYSQLNNGFIKLRNYTVGTLPTGTQGDTAYVTDALAPTYLTTVVGGGAIVTPVFHNGTNWVCH